jgi:hypothetical protein
MIELEREISFRRALRPPTFLASLRFETCTEKPLLELITVDVNALLEQLFEWTGGVHRDD